MQNFWEKLDKPFFVLAPMYDVTDFVFREMFARYSKPQIMVTEFTSVDALCSEKGRLAVTDQLRYSSAQRPIVAQIWGTDPEKFNVASRIIKDLGFDGIDINMGCPQSKEIEHGACAALIKNPELARSIIRACQEGGQGLPVSVKTRIGYAQIQTEEWVSELLQAQPAALTLHARTKKEMSKVPAHWEEIAKAVAVRDQLKSKTLIVGNGDVKSYGEGLARAHDTGCDGIMVGRGAFGNPRFFSTENHDQTIEEKLSVMLEHAKLFEKEYANKKPFVIMRKHFKAYANGFPGAHDLRSKLMETQNVSEVEYVVRDFLALQKTPAQMPASEIKI